MICFFFNDTATTEIYTLSLHDALPIFCAHDRAEVYLARPLPGRTRGRDQRRHAVAAAARPDALGAKVLEPPDDLDRKSTRLNSSHANISYAVFCLKKKKYI